MDKIFTSDNVKSMADRIKKFWEKHGFAVVLLACACIIALTGFFGVRMREQEKTTPGENAQVTGEVNPTPVPMIITAGSEEAEQAALVTTPAPASLELTWPVKGEVSLGYHAYTLAYNETLGEYATHPAIDIKTSEGEAVRAAHGGTVESVRYDESLGNVIVIRHDGFYTGYASLADSGNVKEGQVVRGGEVIATAGTSALDEVGTGIHIHFYVLDENGSPIDPISLLPIQK